MFFMTLTLPTVTAAALLDSVNPCAISVLLLTIGFLFSLSQSRRRIFLVAGSYIAGIFVVYMLIGLGVLRALTLFGVPKALSKIGAAILTGTGIVSLLGVFFPSFPVKLVIPSAAKPGIAALMMKSSVPAAFAMGVAVGMFEFPCTGGPYLAILALLHDQATVAAGALYLLYYNLIFIAPLVFLLTLANNVAVTQRLERWRKQKGRAFEIVSSVAMILLGVVIFLLSP